MTFNDHCIHVCQDQMPALTPDMEAWKSFEVMIQRSVSSLTAVHKEFLTGRLMKPTDSFWFDFIALLLTHQVEAHGKTEDCFCGDSCFVWWSKSSLSRSLFSEPNF